MYGIRNQESGMGKSFKYSAVRVFLQCLSKIISNLQYFFPPVTFNYKILSRKSQKFRSLSLIYNLGHK